MLRGGEIVGEAAAAAETLLYYYNYLVSYTGTSRGVVIGSPGLQWLHQYFRFYSIN